MVFWDEVFEDMINTLLEKKYSSYREVMFEKYYKGVE
jgi:hypothetical protein